MTSEIIQASLFQDPRTESKARRDRRIARAAALSKRESQSEKILDLLREAGATGVTNIALNAVAFRYAARIWELKKLGHDIKSVREDAQVFRYILRERA